MQRVELKKTSNSPFVKGHKLGFQKGHSGYGLQVRRDKRLVSRALELELERTVKDKKGNVKKRLQRIADAIVTAAELGDVSAFNAIANRVEGMPMQIIEQNTNLNARVLAAQVTTKITPAEAARMYQRELAAPDTDDDEDN